MWGSKGLIQIATALSRPTETWYLVLFNREMIICRHARTGQHMDGRAEGQRVRTIGDLTAELNVLLRVYHNLLLPTDRDDLRSTVGVARMIDESTGGELASSYTVVKTAVTHPRFPFFVASTTRSSSIRNK